MPKSLKKVSSKKKPDLKKVAAKVEEPKIEIPVEPVVEPAVEEPKVELNPNVKVVELNGRRYHEIFNPADGTTRMELLE
jgi:hypothetical protein